MNDMPGKNYDIVTDLRDRYGEIAGRADELIDAATRVPAVIDSDELAGKVGDYVKQVMACVKNAEAGRVKEKEPHLEAGRQVDAWFKKITGQLETVKTTIERRLTMYLREKEAAERRAREEAARLEREAAERARAEAEAAEKAIRDAASMEDAIAAEERRKKAQADADKAAKEAAAKPAELSRNRGDMGSVASLRTFWDMADLDIAALDLEALRHHIPREALEKAVRSLIRSGVRELRGVRIFENTQAAVR